MLAPELWERVFLCLLHSGNYADLARCELVCRQFLCTMRTHVWARLDSVRWRLSAYDVDLWVYRQQRLQMVDEQAAFKRDKQQRCDKFLAALLSRCRGASIRHMDLSQCAKWKGLYHWDYTKRGSDDPAGVCSSFCALEKCPRLETLDLSGILLDGSRLSAIAHCLRRSLKRLILRDCFHSNLFQQDGWPPEQWPRSRSSGRIRQHQLSELFQLCTLLVHLDLSDNFIYVFNGLTFDALGRLCHVDVQGTWLSGAQLLQIVACTKHTLGTLRCTLVRPDDDNEHAKTSQEQLDAIVGSLEVLTVLDFRVLGRGLGMGGAHSLNIHKFHTNMLSNLVELRISQSPILPSNYDFVCGLFAPSAHNNEGDSGSHFANLRRVHLEGIPELPLGMFEERFVAIAPRITHLSVWVCECVSDNALACIARIGLVEELRVGMCPKVSDAGFLHFLEHCKNVRLFEGTAEMTDRLLDAVQTEMDRRVVSPGNGGNGLFYFIRSQLHLEYAAVGAPNAQSQRQDLHPRITYCEGPRPLWPTPHL